MLKTNTNAVSRLIKSAIFLISITGLVALQGCGSSGDDALTVDTDPTGYYTGAADVNDGSAVNLHIADLQGMVNGLRFMFMSVDNTLLYDGTITDIAVNDDFTADVTIYKDGLVVSTTTVTGTITEGSQITGTFAGTEMFNGTFTLVFDQSNSEASAISKVENTTGVVWSGQIEPTSFSDQRFSIDSAGTLFDVSSPDNGVFTFCGIGIDTGTISAIANTRLYDISLELAECNDPDVDGSYTGLATTKGTDDILVFAYADGAYAAFADYTLSPK